MDCEKCKDREECECEREECEPETPGYFYVNELLTLKGHVFRVKNINAIKKELRLKQVRE